jgi:hypothetical protein
VVSQFALVGESLVEIWYFEPETPLRGMGEMFKLMLGMAF